MKKLFLIPIAIAAVAALMLGYSSPLVDKKVVFQAPAITENGEGTLATFQITLKPGEGRILVNVENAVFREDSENSLRKAKRIAENFTGLKLRGYDVVAEIDGGERIVGGESAGAVFSAAIASAASGRKMRGDVTGSAAVSEEGVLAPIDGVEEKIRASVAAGKKYFVVAKQQQVNRELELAQNIRVIRVANAAEAIQLMLE